MSVGPERSLMVENGAGATMVIGIIGPDLISTREALRAWTRAVAPTVLARFAVSLRDRAREGWWSGVARPAEPDVDFLDCMGQSSGASVVILSLFDAWLRHAVVRYPDALFIGRADSDTVPNPGWLLSLASAARSFGVTHVYAGTIQWYCWDTVKFRPWGWALGPYGSRRSASRENPQHCLPKASSARCSGPFPFASGPLLIMSSALARWYGQSVLISRTVAQAITSRLNHTADDGTIGATLSVDEARARGVFLRQADPGDLDVRLWDDIFLGHALCMGGSPNVSLLEFPPGLVADVPCNGHAMGCRNGIRRFNFSADGAPLVLHRVKKSSFVGLALEHVRTASYQQQTPRNCKPLALAMDVQRRGVPLACGIDWQLCKSPFGNPERAKMSPSHLRAPSRGSARRGRESARATRHIEK